jgi:hypothetical protein
MTDFISKSKDMHSLKEAKPYWSRACYVNDNDDSRRHHAMLEECLSLLEGITIDHCLSIGDSRARDAAYAKQRLGCHAIASDLNAKHIKEAVKDGFIDEAVNIDVERIPYADNSIDLVLGKETFHHWPRPMLGLYEMVRVANKAVALIEPFDVMPQQPTPYIEVGQYHDSYEEVGNYKYQLSLREILKTAWAMGLPAVAAKGFNDPYQANQSFDDWKNRKLELDRLGCEGSRQFNLMAVVIFKDIASLGAPCLALPPCGRLYTKPSNPYELA